MIQVNKLKSILRIKEKPMLFFFFKIPVIGNNVDARPKKMT